MTYAQWAQRHPHAAAELTQLLTAHAATPADSEGAEQKAQQAVRLDVAQQGGYSWRNNVGATPSKIRHTCQRCGFVQVSQSTPIRYGLANDSMKLNKFMKSSDLILAIPRTVTPDMVGQTIAQFGSVEVKRPGWRYTGTEREQGQAAWLALITQLGGFATFSTGSIKL